ncbi:MAG: membrane protein insertion efficiency factor YidD [Deltaproteobacteria bacterium]|nr:membrane protein insertion efficiency factor YidD [Deltaproteobacteria bacterium]
MKFFIPIFLISCLISLSSPAAEWGPGSFGPVSQKGETFRSSTAAASNLPERSPFAKFLVVGVRFFQKFISPVDGDRCTMDPTCSHFALQSIEKHGALLGFMMTADRIVHEYEEHRFVRARWDGKSYRFPDPVKNNDFWFPSSAAASPGRTKRSKQP